jgi:hypothetical protein
LSGQCDAWDRQSKLEVEAEWEIKGVQRKLAISAHVDGGVAVGKTVREHVSINVARNAPPILGWEALQGKRAFRRKIKMTRQRRNKYENK